jgi:hypothetical protein
MFPPQLIEEPVGRDDLVRVDEQKREEGTLLLTAERDYAVAAVADLQRPEDPEVQHVTFVALIRTTENPPLAGRFRGIRRAADGPQGAVGAPLNRPD